MTPKKFQIGFRSYHSRIWGSRVTFHLIDTDFFSSCACDITGKILPHRFFCFYPDSDISGFAWTFSQTQLGYAT